MNIFAIDRYKYTTKQKIAKRIEKLRQRIIYLESIPTGCDTCASFDGRGCQLANGITPPPEVIQEGCPEWRWDEIPF